MKNANREWVRALKVGDTVYLANRWRQGKSREVRVTKVGTKWTHLETADRLSREDGALEDHHNWEAYQSPDAYALHVERTVAWHSLRAFFGKPYPSGMTLERMNEIAQLAGAPLPSEENADLAPKKS